MDYKRITPENITTLEPNEIFVFGSNQAGKHIGGAARVAMKFGAKYGEGVGHFGQTCAIPTLDENFKKLPLHTIAADVKDFIQYASVLPNLTFFVTAIGTGIAGFTMEEIAPMFSSAISIKNICLPLDFWRVIGSQK